MLLIHEIFGLRVGAGTALQIGRGGLRGLLRQTC